MANTSTASVIVEFNTNGQPTGNCWIGGKLYTFTSTSLFGIPAPGTKTTIAYNALLDSADSCASCTIIHPSTGTQTTITPTKSAGQ